MIGIFICSDVYMNVGKEKHEYNLIKNNPPNDSETIVDEDGDDITVEVDEVTIE